MSENKAIQAFRKVLREHPEMFTALEEYDRTRRLPKMNYKKRANFTINADILHRFRRYCKNHSYNMSSLLEKYIREELKKESAHRQK